MFNLYSPLTYSTGDIIDTYVYRQSLVNGQYSFGTAVGLFKSGVSLLLTAVAYKAAWVADPVPLFSAYSGKHFPGSWQEDENGNLMYGSIHEGNRKALERMAEWHKNGWIFQEAAATGAWDAMNQFTEGKRPASLSAAPGQSAP